MRDTIAKHHMPGAWAAATSSTEGVHAAFGMLQLPVLTSGCWSVFVTHHTISQSGDDCGRGGVWEMDPAHKHRCRLLRKEVNNLKRSLSRSHFLVPMT